MEKAIFLPVVMTIGGCEGMSATDYFHAFVVATGLAVGEVDGTVTQGAAESYIHEVYKILTTLRLQQGGRHSD